MADPPADPTDRQTTAPTEGSSAPLPGTSTQSPLEGSLSGAPGSALEGAAQVDPAQARAALDRNRFLAGATIGVGGLMSAVIAVPALGFVLAPVFKEDKYYDIDLGPVSNFPQDGKYVVVTFEREPHDQSGLNRRVAFVRRNKAGSPAGEFTVISNTCMHLGCPIRSFATGFGCPCHGGQYDTEGRRTAGPPVRPLNRYKYSIRNGRLILGQLMATESVTNSGQASLVQLKGPGQPVNGVLSFLYPPAPQ